MDQFLMPRRLAITALAAFATVACAANAADRTQTFADAKAVTVKDFIGTVEVAAGGGDVRVVMTDGASTYPVDLSVHNGVLVIAGEKRSRNFHLHRHLNWKRDGEDAFRVFLKDYPHLAITAPKGTDIEFDDAIVIALVDTLGSNAKVGRGYLDAAFGDMKSADISLSGSGDISMGHIAETLDVAIGGSGDFEALSAKSADLSIGGSGDIRLGPVAGDVRVRIGGSGDVNVASVGGAVEAAIHGSGDIFAGDVGKGAMLSVAGSGDIALASINGPATATIAGGGNIGVKNGRAEDLKVTIAGSGDFTFGGVSTNLDASVIGSGAVSVAENEGRLSYAGHGGELIVGGKHVRKSR